MSKFSEIDNKLKELAKQLGTTVATSGGGHSFDGVTVPKDKLEMRKIAWIDGAIGKGILINQNFENRNIEAPDWDFTNIAWLHDIGPKAKRRPFWRKYLMKKVKFDKIATNIDQLLKESLANLAAIKKTDLGYK